MAFVNSQNNTAPANQTTERPATQVWINVGYDSQPHPITGEVKFVSTPVGISLDNSKPKKLPNNEGDYRDLVIKQNALLASLEKLAATLKSGERKMLNLKVEIRRIDAPVATEKPAEQVSYLDPPPLF